MLACVCQPADPGIFRRSPIPLGAPPLKFNHKGAIPKPGRTLRIPVITDEPKHPLVNCKNNTTTNNAGKSNKSEMRKKVSNSDIKSSYHKVKKPHVSVNKCTIENTSAAIIVPFEAGSGEEEELVAVKGSEGVEREKITVGSKEVPGANLKSADKGSIRKLNDFEKV